MSLKSLPIPPGSEEIALVAHAVFPRGNVFMQVRDTLGTIYTDEAFADLFPTHGQPAEAPWRLALVTVFQCMENLTDRQAADAVRDRLAWKYALSLELTDNRKSTRLNSSHANISYAVFCLKKKTTSMLSTDAPSPPLTLPLPPRVPCDLI